MACPDIYAYIASIEALRRGKEAFVKERNGQNRLRSGIKNPQRSIPQK
jgi:hypothetical protein